MESNTSYSGSIVFVWRCAVKPRVSSSAQWFRAIFSNCWSQLYYVLLWLRIKWIVRCTLLYVCAIPGIPLHWPSVVYKTNIVTVTCCAYFRPLDGFVSSENRERPSFSCSSILRYFLVLHFNEMKLLLTYVYSFWVRNSFFEKLNFDG